MLKLTKRYAKALLEYAEEHGLEEIYRQSLTLVLKGRIDPQATPEAIGAFLQLIPGDQEAKLAVLYAFLDMAREQLNLLEAQITTAVPLRPEQLAALERKLIQMFRKQVDITTNVDPSILGGVRVIINNTVLDDTIKRKLSDLKAVIYEGVYMKQ